MKPTRLQYFFASGVPLFAVFVSVSLGAVVLAFVILEPPVELLTSWRYLLLLLIVGIVSLVVGVLLASVFLFMLFCPYVALCGYLNGAPFQKGDYIRVLTGPHRDRVARVCEVDRSYQSVRVELGEGNARPQEVVFSYDLICIDRRGDESP
jgi:hypothetical protein